MAGTFRIARIFGFDVNVHWSWLLIFVLLTWTYATGILEEFYPEWTDARRWIVGNPTLEVVVATTLDMAVVTPAAEAAREAVAIALESDDRTLLARMIPSLPASMVMKIGRNLPKAG